MALVVTAANAAVEVTYKGAPLANGAEIEVTNKDFKDNSLPDYGYFEWQAEVEVDVEAGDPLNIKAEATFGGGQVCSDTNCFSLTKKADADVWTLDRTLSGVKALLLHMTYEEEFIPTATNSLKLTLTDDDEEPFVFTIISKTVDDGAAVEGIDMENAQVVAVYDMQGRRVAADFRGAAIVVYDNGKALKQIRK